ncbi:hypothetical protein ACFVIM_35025 [Streptomyces sp. NPDC057638]|uniref:hypothetical protein n=1 Tax=Streptomyces sp. NPDC057638 TaxID=3346190 RepID=UPI0036954F38
MITARLRFDVRRARLFRGPLRVVWVALLLLGLAYTHGTGTESAAHHLAKDSFTTFSAPLSGQADDTGSPGAATAPRERAPETARHGDGTAHESPGAGSAHPVERCMPSQPQLTSTAPTPCSDGPGPSPDGRGAPQARPTAIEATTPSVPPPGGGAPTILRM